MSITYLGSLQRVWSMGEVGVAIVRGLLDRGIDVGLHPFEGHDPRWTPPDLLALNTHKREWLLTLTTSGFDWAEHYEREHSYLYFPYESIRPPSPRWVDFANEKYGTILTPSRWCQGHLSRMLGRSVGLISHGVDGVHYPFIDRSRRVYDEEHPFTFLNVSNGNPRKNLWGAIDAFKDAFPGEKKVSLVIKMREFFISQGKNYYPEDLNRLVADPRIVFKVGHYTYEAMPSLYIEADAYIFPTLSEGFSLTTLHAMSTGMPVILSDHTAVSEQCNDAYNYPIRRCVDRSPYPDLDYGVMPDREETAHLMRHVYLHRDEAFEMGRGAADWTRRHWTWDRAVDQLVAVLNPSP